MGVLSTNIYTIVYKTSHQHHHHYYRHHHNHHIVIIIILINILILLILWYASHGNSFSHAVLYDRDFFADVLTLGVGTTVTVFDSPG